MGVSIGFDGCQHWLCWVSALALMGVSIKENLAPCSALWLNDLLTIFSLLKRRRWTVFALERSGKEDIVNPI